MIKCNILQCILFISVQEFPASCADVYFEYYNENASAPSQTDSQVFLK